MSLPNTQNTNYEAYRDAQIQPNYATSTRRSLPTTQNINNDTYREAQVQPMIPQCRPLVQIPRGKKQPRAAGISRSGGFIFFHDTQKVVVHRLSCFPPPANSSVRGPSEKYFSHNTEAKGQMIQRVAIDGHWIAVCTNEHLVIIDMEDNSMTNRRAHGDWESVGLAVHKSDSKFWVVLGQCKLGRSSWEGRVLLFSISLSVPLSSVILEPRMYSVPQNDKPMNVDISSDGTFFMCLTRLQNSVIVWKLLPDFGQDQSPFIISRRCTPVSTHLACTFKYHVSETCAIQETGIYGVTSTSIYTSGKHRRYLFGTTFASTERWHNGGEWPFCSPIVFPDEKNRVDSIHNLESLRDRRCIVASAVSSQANVLVALEMSGRISVLGLKAHEQAGICVLDEEPTILEASLSAQTTQSQICPNALRFDPSGTRLFALGVDGKLIVVDFVAPQDVPTPTSPSSSNSSRSRLSFFGRSRS